jgi:hypothetical protein
MESQVVASDASSAYKSPLRMLVRFFRRSRDNWKQKYMGIKAEIKRFKNQAADARRSREKWKAKAEALAAEVQRLEAERDARKPDADKKNRRVPR